uniref:Ras-like GTP-binding protein Rho1 n=1 Tax=Elaeophora elaphi TaxID=1147741 RepID=A0A0R3RPV5_9BILA
MTLKQFKFVVVGDGSCGKTSLIIAQAGGEFIEQYTPTAFDDYAIEAFVNGKTKMLTVCDTAGEDDYNNLRPLSYPDTDVFIVCYSVERPESLKSVEEKWIPEIRRFCPDVPVLVVGNKKDIRNEKGREQKACDENSQQKNLVNFDEAIACAKKFSDHRVIECSAKTKEGIRQVFDAAIRIATTHRAGKSSRVLNSIMKLKLVF